MNSVSKDERLRVSNWNNCTASISNGTPKHVTYNIKCYKLMSILNVCDLLKWIVFLLISLLNIQWASNATALSRNKRLQSISSARFRHHNEVIVSTFIAQNELHTVQCIHCLYVTWLPLVHRIWRLSEGILFHNFRRQDVCLLILVWIPMQMGWNVLS